VNAEQRGCWWSVDLLYVGKAGVIHRMRYAGDSRTRGRSRSLGYRRLTVLLKREGWKVNAKRIYRLYTEEGLIVRTKQRKKLASRNRLSIPSATAPNQRWSMDFVHARLDPNTGGGKRGDAYRLKQQMRKLFKATISFHENMQEPHRHGERWLDMQIAPMGELWWDPKQPEQGTLWGSWVELGEKFFQAITAAPVPVDTRVLRALKKSPLALDLYAWATWRVFKLQRPLSFRGSG
jgi:hypothetical protein